MIHCKLIHLRMIIIICRIAILSKMRIGHFRVGVQCGSWRNLRRCFTNLDTTCERVIINCTIIFFSKASIIDYIIALILFIFHFSVCIIKIVNMHCLANALTFPFWFIRVTSFNSPTVHILSSHFIINMSSTSYSLIFITINLATLLRISSLTWVFMWHIR